MLRSNHLLPILAALLVPAAAAPPDWDPAPPPANRFDWIQLNSGEWLKGTVKSSLDDELVFDSDVLGLLTIDHDDIRLLRTAKPVRVGYETRERDRDLLVDRKAIRVVEDRIEVRRGRVTRRDSGEEIAPVARVVALAEDADNEWQNWNGKFSAGANLRRGNTRQIDYNARIELERLTARSRVDLQYLGNYGKAEGVEFANNHRVDLNWDRHLNRRLFLRPLSGSWLRDPYQNIGWKLQIGGGAGYALIDHPDHSWKVAAGPAYQHVVYDSVPFDTAGSQSSPGFFLQSHFETEINDHVDFTSLYRMVATESDAGLYAHHFENSLSFELTNDLDFDVSLIWDHVREPTRRADGSFPARDDLRLLFLLGLEL